MTNDIMNAHERAELLFKRAEVIGMDRPSEGMVAEAIHDAECDALNFPHRVNALGGESDFIKQVKLCVGRLAERLATDMDHRCKDHSKWYEAVKKVRKELGITL